MTPYVAYTPRLATAHRDTLDPSGILALPALALIRVETPRAPMSVLITILAGRNRPESS